MSSTIYVGEYKSGGSRNRFYHIVGSQRKYGFKEFQNKELASWSRNVQHELSKVTAAPFVTSEVGRISLHKGGLSNWGYVTEVASEIVYCKNNACCCDLYSSVENCPVGKGIRRLVDIMNDMGLYFNDGHSGNFGMVKRKSKKIVVLIDTGVEGFHNYDETVWGKVDEEENEYNEYSDECDCSECMRYSIA
jgi:hypothetical protein